MTRSPRPALAFAAFGVLLAAMAARIYPGPATIDSLICALSVAEFRPGFLDGKPTYAVAGQIVAAANSILGGDRADLMRLLALWSALFAWGMLLAVYLISRDLHRGSATRGWMAVALLASSPVFAFMAAIVEKYTVALFFLLAAALLWGRRRYAAFGLAWGLALGSHLMASLLAIPCAMNLCLDRSRRREARRAAGGAALAAAVAVPLYAWVVIRAGGLEPFLDGLRRIVFGQYEFMKSLSPSRLLGPALASPLRLAAGIALAGAALLGWRLLGRWRVSGLAPLSVAILGAGALAIVARVESRHLPALVRMAGPPLLALGGIRLGLLLAARLRGDRSGDAGPERALDLETFVLPWLVTNVLFFVVWDRFYGQFSVFIVPPLALLGAAAGSGRAAPPAPAESGEGEPAGRVARWEMALVAAAVAGGLFVSYGVVERTRWKVTGENDLFARETAARVPAGSLVVAGWDGINLVYQAPGLDTLAISAGDDSRNVDPKEKRRHADVAGEIRRALREGRRAYVTRTWLDEPLNPPLDAIRAAVVAEFDLRPAARRLLEAVAKPAAEPR